MGKSRDVSALEEFFDHGATVTNQKSMVVVCKHMAAVPTITPPKNHKLHVSFMGYVARHGLKERFPDETAAMRYIFDAVLGKTFAAYQTSDLSGKLWWEGHKHIAALFIDVEAMNRCCSVPLWASWRPMEMDIFSVVHSCETGMAVFGFAARRLLIEKVREIVTALLEDGEPGHHRRAGEGE